MGDGPTGNLRANISAWYGEAGRRWLAGLPDSVAAYARRWGLKPVGAPFPGGNISHVVPVRRFDGTASALKLFIPDAENAAEATALHHYDGDGAVRLLEHDPAGAMLIERAEPGHALVDEPDRVGAVAIAAAILRRLWRVPGTTPPGFADYPRVPDVTRAWRAGLAASRCLPAALAGRAAATAGELTVPDGPEGLVNRDPHLGNFVAAERAPWLLIDPKPLIGERAFDAGWLIARQLADRPDAGTVTELVEAVADGLCVARERAAAWALVRASATAHWTIATGDGETAFSRGFRAAAVLLADAAASRRDVPHP
ncbi:hydroxyurea phosphotransferase [Actinorhabdospora filicis]|uniref:Hydroxyurea phosphotransferase n=1 Tax=Actinorhabdospora filicis TaxID=1785913 RepID=A0A9W6SMT8_9ACTN|nr:aminoglycoside phosphotransferase family protein [Actinorhabdospora filicis]GLZ78662.1 hydroxyurea phosphotransferase [Actinorhabdospora filicis]